jgi:1-deoxy-D-xylulose-5-phosphate synthase
VFGKGLSELAQENRKIVAITAAMPSGTGTGTFAATHPERFFDVGIAEGHAVTFAAGMATRGLHPFCVIYSTFLQRAYDNVIHDVAIQHLPVVFAMDRAGLVGEDGPTHMGLYDIAYMLAVPGMTVTAPKDGTEMLALLKTAALHDVGPFSMRYPRDAAPDVVPAMSKIDAVPYGTWEILRKGAGGRDPNGGFAILATGTMVLPSLAAAEKLAEEGINATVVNCRFIKPHDEETLASIVADNKDILVVEEGTVVNGFGAHMAAVVAQIDPAVRVIAHGVPDKFIEQAPRARQLSLAGLDAQGIAARAKQIRHGDARGARLRAG